MKRRVRTALGEAVFKVLLFTPPDFLVQVKLHFTVSPVFPEIRLRACGLPTGKGQDVLGVGRRPQRPQPSECGIS